MKPTAPQVVALCGAVTLGTSVAVEAQAPPGFAVKRSGHLETVIYSESVGELHNAVDRKTIEAQCAAARRAGLTDKHPAFEAGYDRPLKTENWRFGNERHWANFSVLHAYGCGRPAVATGSPDRLCGCTYGVQIHRTVHIRKREGGRTEDLLVDLTEGTARRRVSQDPAVADLDIDATRVRALAPEVVGRDVVVGVPCVMRRQRLGAEGWIDRCITEDESKKLSPEMRYRTLSETTWSKDGKELHGWSKAVKVVQNASVDTGVFDLPDGVVTEGGKQ